jgi:uncharacterized spore protein YtfJ
MKSTEDINVELAEHSVGGVERMMQTFLSKGDVTAAYGQPVQAGDTLIIPAAEVVGAVGFGLGFGAGSNEQADEQEKPVPAGGAGGGGGGGGRVFSRPVAVIVAGPNGVEVKPVVDITKVWMAALTAAGFVMASMAKMRKGQIGEADE